jgi:hypothetical protein
MENLVQQLCDHQCDTYKLSTCKETDKNTVVNKVNITCPKCERQESFLFPDQVELHECFILTGLVLLLSTSKSNSKIKEDIDYIMNLLETIKKDNYADAHYPFVKIDRSDITIT